MIYLDNAATSKVSDTVLRALNEVLSQNYGNPSSTHRLGLAASHTLATACKTVAHLLDCRERNITFCAGGTEANNLAIKGIALARPRGKHLIVSAIEHESVLATCDFLARIHGFDVSVIPVDGSGMIDENAFRDALTSDTTLVSFQYANNECGTVQNIQMFAGIARELSVPFHTDAVQAAGWLPLSLAQLGVDAMTISGHKIGAPKGISVLANRVPFPLEALIHGGGQENGLRSGTENVAFAHAFAVAFGETEREKSFHAERVAKLCKTFITRVLASVPQAALTGHTELRLPSIASFVFPGFTGETILLELEARSIVCSSGSACAAGRTEASHVLTACGFTEETALSAIRFSFSRDTIDSEAELAAHALEDSIAKITRMYQKR